MNRQSQNTIQASAATQDPHALVDQVEVDTSLNIEDLSISESHGNVLNHDSSETPQSFALSSASSRFQPDAAERARRAEIYRLIDERTDAYVASIMANNLQQEHSHQMTLDPTSTPQLRNDEIRTTNSAVTIARNRTDNPIASPPRRHYYVRQPRYHTLNAFDALDEMDDVLATHERQSTRTMAHNLASRITLANHSIAYRQAEQMAEAILEPSVLMDDRDLLGERDLMVELLAHDIESASPEIEEELAMRFATAIVFGDLLGMVDLRLDGGHVVYM